jgi:hypothetical protein
MSICSGISLTILQQFLEYPVQTAWIQRRACYLQEYQIIPLPSLSGKKPLLLLALLKGRQPQQDKGGGTLECFRPLVSPLVKWRDYGLVELYLGVGFEITGLALF